ncbi:MAG: phosphoglycerate kinase [Bacilli bacterium]|nr:phosphoglycerate kinase [Bacilli bacterium]
MKTLKDLNIENKKVLLRCDFNVPLKDGEITDDTRIVSSLKTIKYIMDKNAKLIIFSHLGRVKEEADLEANNLLPVAKRLEELLGKEVIFSETTRGLEEKIDNMNYGDILLVQNTRYEDLDGKKESGNDPELGAYWASLGDVFVNDAFGTLHRAHASNVGIASHMEGKSCFGFLVEEELTALQVLDNPERPFMVVLGGAKVADKIGLIDNLAKKADKIIIGGGMSYTFLKAMDKNIGKSLLDEESIDFCKEVLSKYNDKIVLPIDAAVTNEYTEDEEYRVKDIDDLTDDEMGLDIGPKTVELFNNTLSEAKTVIWNGPLGVYEFEKYRKGTEEVLLGLVDNNIKTILGGGDVVAAASACNLKDKVYHACTGGGATLEYLEGKVLPGIDCIK